MSIVILAGKYTGKPCHKPEDDGVLNGFVLNGETAVR